MLLAWGGTLAPESAVVARINLPFMRVDSGYEWVNRRNMSVNFSNPYPHARVLRAVLSGRLYGYADYSFLGINERIYNNFDRESRAQTKTHEINNFVPAGVRSIRIRLTDQLYYDTVLSTSFMQSFADLILTFYYQN